MKNLTPFFSIEAEQSVIGGLLLDNDKWDEISPILSEEHFYVSAHKLIFSAIVERLNKNQAADLITIERILREQKKIEQIDLAYLAELAKNTPSAANIVAYAEIVKRDSQARQLSALGGYLQTETLKANSEEKLTALIADTEKRLTDITLNQQEQDSVAPISEVLDKVLVMMDTACKLNSDTTGTPSGIARLDKYTTGWQPGDLIIIAARPGMGKTALSLTNVVGALEAMPDKPVQYYSLEMPATQIMQRLLALHAQVSIQHIRQPKNMDDMDWAKLSASLGYIQNHWYHRLIIDDTGILTPQILKSRIRRNIRKYGTPSVIFVDYIQLMSDPTIKNNNKNQEITNISNELKRIAKECQCPIVALSQLNRNVENRGDKRPLASDLRDSGSLEQDADLLIFIYRDEFYNKESDLKGYAELIISKQRNGPIGSVFTSFRGEYSCFSNISEEEYQIFGATV